MLRRSSVATAAVLASLVPAAPAAAKTIKVPKDFPTIQEAVDNADPGDVILVAKGTYEESVNIPGGLDGLKVTGDKDVVVDAGSGGPPFTIGSDAVTLQNLELRDGHDHGVDCAADGCRIIKVAVSGEIDGNCLNVAGNDLLVKDSSLRGCGANGIDATGDGGRVEHVKLQSVLGDCVEYVGLDLILLGSLMRGCRGDAVDLDGAGALLEHNRVVTAGDSDQDCYDVTGDDAVLRDNHATNCGVTGFAVAGQNPVLVGNEVKHSLIAFDVECIDNGGGASACSSGRLQGNRAFGVLDGLGFALEVATGTGAFNVIGNTAKGIVGYGFGLDIDGGVIKDNRAERAGVRTADNEQAGFILLGDGNVFSGNVALRNVSDGIQVSGDDNTIRANRAERNTVDGIQVLDGDGNALERNRAFDNGDEGIENGHQGAPATVATDTDAIDNVSKGNGGVDCANDAGSTLSVAVFGNECGDGSDFDPPGTSE